MYYTQHHKNEVGANVNFKTFLARLGKVRKRWYRQQCLIIRRNFGPVDGQFSRICFIMKHCTQFRRKRLESLCVAILLLFNLV